MGKKIKIKIQVPYIAYPGPPVQNHFGEHPDKVYLLWDIKSSKEFSVISCPLPNLKPFITIDWLDTVSKTRKSLNDIKEGSRIRLRSQEKIHLKDYLDFKKILEDDFNIAELITKDDFAVETNVIKTNNQILLKEDLRSADKLCDLLKQYNSTSDLCEEEWAEVYSLIKTYIKQAEIEETVKNKVWSLKNFEFDNLYAYGPGNKINFDKLSGIIGIFGPNRMGKSSLPGTILYTLFNASDRGKIKNIHIINERAISCKGKITFCVDNVDYIVERETIKNENKKGNIFAPTTLKFSKIIDGVEINLNGEQRTDSDKEIRRLIGTMEDFVMTSLSTQGEMNQFIETGSTKRLHLISRFLDVDVMSIIADMSNKDLSVHKSNLKKYSSEDYSVQITNKKNEIENINKRIKIFEEDILILREKLFQSKTKLSSLNTKDCVTKEQVENKKENYNNLITILKNKEDQLSSFLLEKKQVEEKIGKIEILLTDNNLESLKSSLKTYENHKNLLSSLKNLLEAEDKNYKKQLIVVKTLDEVPCGDQFLNCKFIKDAHATKPFLNEQSQKIVELKQKIIDSEKLINEQSHTKISEDIRKIETLKERKSELLIKKNSFISKIEVLEQQIIDQRIKINDCKVIYEKLKNSYQKNENIQVFSLEQEISDFEVDISSKEKEKTKLISSNGSNISILENLETEKEEKYLLLQKMKANEIISNGFSKKSIPTQIVSSMLPVINSKIASILGEIVNFSIELERDPETDDIDLYINYGDNKRILELGSGMEKAFGSIALRVALTSISNLPKSDIFIVDEGFGVFDEASLEAVSRLFSSLKKYFKTIFVITHIDTIKSIIDDSLEIVKKEKNSFVEFV